VVEVKTTADETMTFNNAWWTYHERTDHLVRSRGKVYSLVLGQCTTVLLNKMKQDTDWQADSESYVPLKLLKLIEKFILKQSNSQYKIGIVIKQLKLLLVYWQDDGVTNVAYYDWFKTRVDVTEYIGVSFDNPVLWDWKSQELYSTDYELLSNTAKEAKVKEDVKQAFLVYLFFINSNDKKHSQLNSLSAKSVLAVTKNYRRKFHPVSTLGVIRGNSIPTFEGRSALRHGDGTRKWTLVGMMMLSKAAYVHLTQDSQATFLYTIGRPPPAGRGGWCVILINIFSLLPLLMRISCYDGICGSAGGNSPAYP
jgi:hypothetical protein